MGAGATLLEAALQRERAVLLVGMGGVAAASWAYLVYSAGAMESGMAPSMAMPLATAWGPADLALLLFMWVVMMVAMMLPAVAPFVLLFMRIARRRADGPAGAVATLLLGYLLAWVAFSVVATAVQWGLHEGALLSPMMRSASPTLGGLLLAGAGLFQLTPWKRACLVHCRSPVGFLMAEWRDGQWGALVMGSKHGAYCVGCCWLLMGVLFVVGVMNLVWVAAIAVFVLVERTAPGGEWIGRVVGVALVAAGTALIVA